MSYAITALLDFCSQGTATVFISSHLVHQLERICDWVGVLDHGRWSPSCRCTASSRASSGCGSGARRA
jgi:ABC-type sugar transport system ATPase subunit